MANENVLRAEGESSNDLQTVFYRDFEDGPGGFTADNTGGTLPGLWHYSTGRYADHLPNHTLIHSWYYGLHESSIGAGTYVLPYDHQGVLISPPIAIPNCGASAASFNYVLSTRPELNVDFVDVSVEYVDELNQTHVVPVLSRVQQTLVQTGNHWLTATTDLTPFAGRTIRLRFSFDTGEVPQVDPEGWYIDDVLVTHSPLENCKPHLVVDKEFLDAAVTAGDPNAHTFTIAVSNTGLTAADNVIVSDTLPAGLVIGSASGDGWNCSTPGNALTCTQDHLNPGETKTVNVTYTVPSTTNAGTLNNTASAKSDEVTTPIVDTDTVVVQEDVRLVVDKEFVDASVTAGIRTAIRSQSR